MAKDLTSAWAALSDQASGSSTREPKALSEANPVTAIPARTGSGRPKAAAPGGGIASPLVETAYADRLYWPDVSIVSTDGMITFVLAPIKEIKFTDANSASVVMQYKQPTP